MSTAQSPRPASSRLAAADEFPEERMFTLLHSISFLPSAPAVAHSNRLQSFCVCEFSSKERQGRSGLSSDGRWAEAQGGESEGEEAEP